MSFPSYEKTRVSMCGIANNPSCRKPAVVLGGTFGDVAGTIVYQRGRMPADGSEIYRWLYLKDGEYAGSTDWYASAEDAAEECRVAMRRKGQDKDFSAVVNQTGMFWLQQPDEP